ncbi:MAG: hypothetical protein Q7O66_05770, partial [Dehalococcoidia bacterium]|nr:hypothetical protein [Dehalococcoidia bacterium]
DFDTRLEWRAMAAIPGNLTAYLHLLEADGKKAWAQVDWPVGPRDYPAVLWAKGENVREERRFNIPHDTPPGRYTLFLGTYHYPDVQELPATVNGQSIKRSGVTLGSVYVVGAQTRRGSIDPQYLLKARFGDRLELLGFDLSGREFRPGQKLELTTYWRALSTTTVDYTIFAQLVDAAGNLKGQNDGQPAAGSYPTSLWQEGEYVVDTRTIAIGSTDSGGPYRLFIGLYQWPGLERLPAAVDGRANGNAVELITINRP